MKVKHEILQSMAVLGWDKAQGLAKYKEAHGDKDLCCVEDKLNRLLRVRMPAKVPVQPKLLNHFMVGADPEFVMVDAATETGQLAASKLGLRTGLAFGADMSGRQVEIRPVPSRFVLDVIASVLVTLRWFTIYTANTKAKEYSWKAGAFSISDGLGGHVHFGRKRPKNVRKQEIGALDIVMQTLLDAGIYPQRECQDRIRHTNYGRFGDFRLQTHGYEYRTFPSWLDSPWMAYLTITLAKLAVFDPAFVLEMKKLPVTQTRQRISNFLAYYKGLDDDARIAYATLQNVGWPLYKGGDFKERWGLNYPSSLMGIYSKMPIIPSAIAATDIDKCELLSHLIHGSPIPPSPPQINWEPAHCPEGYASLLSLQDTARQIGMGEILNDAIYHMKYPVNVLTMDGNGLQVGSSLAKDMPEDWRKTLMKIDPRLKATISSNMANAIRLGHAQRELDGLNLTRRLLYSGVFPIWRLKDTLSDSFEKWRGQAAKKQKVPPHFKRCKIVYERSN